MPADDDIDSFWEGIRPPREPQPEPPRKVHQHAARFRESFVGTDEQWDRRARDIQAGGLLTDPRSFTMTEIQGDLDERARLLREWRPAEEQHQIGFSEGTLRAQQWVAQVLREELARAARIPDAMSEEEQGFSVDDRPDVSMGTSVGVDLSHSAPIGAALELLRDPGPFTRPSAPAVPSPLRYEGSQEETILTRLTNDLGALGFHPESISLERSITGGTSLTLHMSPSYELETDSSPDEVSVTFSHRP